MKTRLIYGNEASNCYDKFRFLANDEKLDFFYMTTHSKLECDPLPQTQVCLQLKLLFAAFYRTQSIPFFGHYGQARTYKKLKHVFAWPTNLN